MTPPRILFLDHSGALGGAELYLIDVVRAFQSSARVILFESGPLQERLREEGVSVEICPAPTSFLDVETSAGWLSALKATPGHFKLTTRIAQRARNYDLLYANSQKSFLVAGVAGMLSGRPVIWNLHDMLTADHFSPFSRRAAVTWANLFADRVIVNSRATERAFVNSGGRSGKTSVVYNGIDPSDFDTTSDEDVRRIRRQLDLGDVPCVGVFSRLAPWKGQHVLLNALSTVSDVHALIVGDALFEDDESYARRLRAQARRLGITDRVHFLGFRSDVPRLMSAVDVVVHTSTEPEPFGRVIVEGLLAGRPVIATRAGGAVEILNDPETGWLVPPGDATALADALRDALYESETPPRNHDDRVVSCKRAARGREMARSRFSVERMQSTLENHIHDVVN